MGSTAVDHENGPRFSVCEFTTPDLSFEEDLALYRDAGVTGVSICEVKLRRGDETAQLEATRESGLETAVCIPVDIGVLDCDPVFPGPKDVDGRVAAMCDSIRRLAPFEPASILVLTGDDPALDRQQARRLVVEGLREAARVAAELDLQLSLEPIRPDLRLDISLVSTIPETLELIAEVGAANIDIAYDVYHLWDTPDVIALTEQHAAQIGGVHVCDWRQPTPGVGDRLLPGDGVIDLPGITGALERGGFDGWYDLEIFSDKSLPDSLWNLPPAELVERGRAGFLRAWAARSDVPAGGV